MKDIDQGPHCAEGAETKLEAAARPLPELAKLIKQDLAEGDKAGMPYYKAAGEKLIEAKRQLEHGKFTAWVKTNFKISNATSWRYMKMAEANLSGLKDFKSEGEFFREKSKAKKRRSNLDFEAAGEVNDEEQELRRKLALKIIAIGYRSISKTLHPDKGGPDEEMPRLNAVRDELKSIYGKSRTMNHGASKR